MKLVREYIDFERGRDPKEALGIGAESMWRSHSRYNPSLELVDLVHYEKWNIFVVKIKQLGTVQRSNSYKSYSNHPNWLSSIRRYPSKEEALETMISIIANN